MPSKRRVALCLPAQLLNKVYKFVLEDPLQSFRGVLAFQPADTDTGSSSQNRRTASNIFTIRHHNSNGEGKTPCLGVEQFFVFRRLLCHARVCKGEIMRGTSTKKLETILVVDDDEKVLKVVVGIFKRAKFQLLSADNGVDAIKLAKETKGKIDVLLSKVDMPQMSGPDLGETLKKARPDMHVMLMSGGAKGSLLVLSYGWAFIQRPLVTGEADSNGHECIALTKPVTTRRS
jgi:CheY-like chemotaxis protein